MKNIFLFILIILLTSVNFTAKTDEQNSLDTLYFEDLIEMKKNAIESKNLIPKPLRIRIFGIYDNEILIRGTNVISKMNFHFRGKLLNIRDADLELDSMDGPPAYMAILYCEIEECLQDKSKSYFGFEENKLIYAQHYEILNWKLENKDNFNIIITKFRRTACEVFVKKYEEDCKNNLIKIENDKDYIKLSFDLQDFSFSMGKGQSMNAKKLIINNDIKLIHNSKLRYWNLRNPRFDSAKVSLETLSKVRKYIVKIPKEEITDSETNQEDQFKPKILLEKLLGVK